MRLPLKLLWLAACLFLLPLSARAEWDPHSTKAAPCGIGVPPRGHTPREFAPPGREKHLSLTVKQDGDRLCYVADGIAEAPVIRLHPGDQLTITLRNEITDPAAIDTYLPTTRLDQARPPVPVRAGLYPVIPGMRHKATGMTNLHLHGFPVPPVSPQDEVLRTCIDPAVGPQRCGRREFTYVYEVPKAMPTGLYWYHPHLHGEAEAQVQMGLLGAIVVEGPADEARRAAGIEDRVLILGQTRNPPKPGGNGAVTGVAMDDHAVAPRRAISTAPAKIDTDHVVGCGSLDTDGILTLNGTPIGAGQMEANRLMRGDAIAGFHLDSDGDMELDRIRRPIAGSDGNLAKFAIPAGGKQLWRVVNGATDDYLNLAVVDEEGAPTAFEIVARDGAPLTDDSGKALPPESVTDRQLLPPAGRLEFLITPPPPGHEKYLVSDAVDTGCAGDPEPARQLAVITSGPAAASPPVAASATSAAASAPDLFAGLLARKTDRVRIIALAEYPRPGNAGGADENDFYITELKPGAELRPFAMNGPPVITVHAGAVEEWVIENWTHELHAFHIHQLHFRVLEENGRPLPNPPLLDVVNVPFASPDAAMPPGWPLVPGRIRIKLYFPQELAGDIPFHCHLMQHEDNGMMGVIRVLPAWSRSPVLQHAGLPFFPASALAAICHAEPGPLAKPGFAASLVATLHQWGLM